jgi:predicted RNA binding protein YcfA (HicA-like mRNA interferase family)
MPLKPLAFKEVKRRLNNAGFEIVSQKGSHVKFAKETEEGRLTAIVPKYKEITIGTLSSILKQAGLSISEFDNL